VNPSHLLSLVPLFALLVWAAVEDARVRRIRNWLTLSLVLTGWAHNAGTFGGLAWATAGLAVGFALTVGPFALGAWGAGDVKLMAGVGAWVGPGGALAVFMAEALVGMVIVLVQAAAAGRLRTLGRNSLVLAVNLAHVRQVGTEHARATGLACRSVDRPLPYAVPTAVAVILLAAAGVV
jgi:prepilin peptidase CpaA